MSLQLINVYLIYVLCLALFVVLVAKWKQLPNALRSFALYCFFMAVFQIVAPYILRAYGENVSYYGLVNNVYLTFIYLTIRNLLNTPTLRRIVDILGLTSILGCMVMSILVYGDPIVGYQLRLVYSIFIVLFGLIYFFDLLKHVSQKSLFKRWDFILVGALFFYNLSSLANRFIVWISLKLEVNVGQANYINLVLYDIELILFTYAVWLYFRKLNGTGEDKLKTAVE